MKTSSTTAVMQNRPFQAPLLHRHPSLDTLQSIERTYPWLGKSLGIYELRGPLKGFDVRADVEMDCIASCEFVTGREVLATSGVVSCVAVCAVGCNAQGRPMGSILWHASAIWDDNQIEHGLAQMGLELRRMGATNMRFMLVGGCLAGSPDEACNSLSFCEQLLEVGTRLGVPWDGARLGLSQPIDFRQGTLLHSRTQRPAAATVLLTADGVLYQGEPDYGPCPLDEMSIQERGTRMFS